MLWPSNRRRTSVFADGSSNVCLCVTIQGKKLNLLLMVHELFVCVCLAIQWKKKLNVLLMVHELFVCVAIHRKKFNVLVMVHELFVCV